MIALRQTADQTFSSRTIEDRLLALRGQLEFLTKRVTEFITSPLFSGHHKSSTRIDLQLLTEPQKKLLHLADQLAAQDFREYLDDTAIEIPEAEAFPYLLFGFFDNSDESKVGQKRFSLINEIYNKLNIPKQIRMFGLRDQVGSFFGFLNQHGRYKGSINTSAANLRHPIHLDSKLYKDLEHFSVDPGDKLSFLKPYKEAVLSCLLGSLSTCLIEIKRRPSVVVFDYNTVRHDPKFLEIVRIIHEVAKRL